MYWCAEDADALASLQPHHPGEVVPVAAGLVKWRAWDGEKFNDVSEEANSGWLELRHLGMFEGSDGKAQSSLLLSARETDVPAVDSGKAGAVQEDGLKWAGGGNWSTSLLWIALGVLLLESWLFHRHAVY